MDIDIKSFSEQRQQADVCVLFSYWRFLQYYNPKLSFHDFCRFYILYINGECNILNNSSLVDYINKEISVQKNNPIHANKDVDVECKLLLSSNLAEYIKNLNPLPLEILTYAVFHCYCQIVQNNIRGLSHINSLHYILKQKNDIPFSIPNSDVHFTEKQKEITQHIDELLQGIIDFLILLFNTSRGGHTIILVKHKNELYIGDPNVKKFKKLSEYIALPLSPKFDVTNYQSITECLIIKK